MPALGRPEITVSLAVAGLALLTTSCVLGPKPILANNVLEGGHCAPPPELGVEGGRARPDDPALSTHSAEQAYTPRSLETARAIGAATALERLADAEAHHAPREEVIDLRGQLNDTIFYAVLELGSVVARARCEEGRAEQIADDLRDAEGQQSRRLTAYSLVTSAVSAIGAGVLTITMEDQTPAAVVGIAGGVVGGALGFGTLRVHRQTPFPHERNLLGQVWYGREHPDIPAIVWAYLTRPLFTKSGDRSIRDSIVDMWRQSGRLGDDPAHLDPARIALYFGDGGVYDADGLDDRSNMLSELAEAMGLMTYDLQLLVREAAHR